MPSLQRIRPLAEDPDIDTIIAAAGGRRAHDDADSRDLRNSDYVLGSSIIELKMLEDERLDKPEAQEKMALLFEATAGERPVVVLDRSTLGEVGQREYDTVMRAPIKNIVRSAKAQLKQTRSELDTEATNVLLVINNGFTALSHEELLGHVVGRAKNDTDQIDAVVVAGCYFYGDGFESWAMWPMDLVAIREERPFREFDKLKGSWDELANRHMTEFVRGQHGSDAEKEVQTDVVFDREGRTYVKPGLQVGAKSEFYGNRRPRLNRVAFAEVRHVVRTIPRLSAVEFRRVRPALRDEPLMASFATWEDHVFSALQSGAPDQPVVPADISRGSWEAWRRKNPGLSGMASFSAAANSRYGVEASKLVHAAREVAPHEPEPRRYVWVLVEQIGRDELNDVAHIGMVVDGVETPLVSNLRMGHYNALALAAGHAIRLRLPQILWSHDLKYAWT